MIKKNLLLLGIQYKFQLEENDLHFWWKKKYSEILKSDLENKNELLISLNNALEDLEKIDLHHQEKYPHLHQNILHLHINSTNLIS